MQSSIMGGAEKRKRSEGNLFYDTKLQALKNFEELSKLRECGDSCDFLIKAGSAEIPVHKNVLVANSEYFRAMLRHDTLESQTGCVELKDVDEECLRICINFMYCDEVSTPDGKEEDLLCIADMLGLHGLFSSICEYYRSVLNDRNFYGIKKVANDYCSIELGKICDKFALENFEAIAQLEEYKNIDVEYLKHLLQAEDNKTSQTNKLKALLNWTRFDTDSRCEFFMKVLESFDFSQLSVRFIEYLIDEEPLTSKSIECVKILCKRALKTDENVKPCCRVMQRKANSVVLFTENPYQMQCLNLEKNELTQMQRITDIWMDHRVSAIALGDFLYVVALGERMFRLKYSDSTAVWELLPPMITAHGYGPPMVTDGTSIYVLCKSAYHQLSIEKFEPRSKKWTLLQDYMEHHEGCAYAYFDNSIYCAGGFDDIYENSELGSQEVVCPRTTRIWQERTVDFFDLKLKIWGRAAPMLHGRSSAAAVALDNKLYVMGGEPPSGPDLLNRVECYTLETNMWTLLSPMLADRFNLEAFVIGGDIFAVGGNEDIIVIERYNPAKDEWKAVNLPNDVKLDVRSSAKLFIQS